MQSLLEKIRNPPSEYNGKNHKPLIYVLRPSDRKCSNVQHKLKSCYNLAVFKNVWLVHDVQQDLCNVQHK